jgi:hypothetical protein
MVRVPFAFRNDRVKAVLGQIVALRAVIAGEIHVIAVGLEGFG